MRHWLTNLRAFQLFLVVSNWLTQLETWRPLVGSLTMAVGENFFSWAIVLYLIHT